MELKIEYLPLSALTPYEGNARKHADEDINAIMASIQEFGFDDPIGIWGKNNTIVEGHGRLLAAKELGMETVPVIRLDHLTDEQRRAYALAHNKTAELSGWDFGQLEIELAGIDEVDMSAFGFADALPRTIEDEQKGSMAEKYLVPPFSVIYANKPEWLTRKRAWVLKGIRSEIGRGGKLCYNSKKNPVENFRGGQAQAYRDSLIESYMKKGSRRGRSL